MTERQTGFTLDDVDDPDDAPSVSPVRENFERGFRRTFILRFFVVLAFAFGAWSGFLYVALERNFGSRYGLAFFSLVHVRSALVRYVLYSTIAQAAILALLTAAMTIFFSHKIAGPVYRMKMFLRAWRKSEKAPGGMRLRKGDQAQRFASVIEITFGELAARGHRMADKAEALAARLEAGEPVPSHEIEDMRRAIEQFKIG
jgi:hypothetical protein